jgi:hypothetical protein
LFVRRHTHAPLPCAFYRFTHSCAFSLYHAFLAPGSSFVAARRGLLGSSRSWLSVYLIALLVTSLRTAFRLLPRSLVATFAGCIVRRFWLLRSAVLPFTLPARPALQFRTPRSASFYAFLFTTPSFWFSARSACLAPFWILRSVPFAADTAPLRFPALHLLGSGYLLWLHTFLTYNTLLTFCRCFTFYSRLRFTFAPRLHVAYVTHTHGFAFYILRHIYHRFTFLAIPRFGFCTLRFMVRYGAILRPLTYRSFGWYVVRLNSLRFTDLPRCCSSGWRWSLHLVALAFVGCCDVYVVVSTFVLLVPVLTQFFFGLVTYHL